MADAIRAGLLEAGHPDEGPSTSALQTTWRVPVILVSFSDSLLRYGAADFENLLFDSTGATPTGSAYDYYRWVSGNRLSLRGKVVAKVQLPNTRAYYANNASGLLPLATPNNAFGLVWDAIRYSPTSINWADYDLDHDGYVDMVWIIHAGPGGEATQDKNNMWSITSRMTSGWRSGTFYTTEDPVPGAPNSRIRLDRFTILPELSVFSAGAISEIGVYCHEFGHCLGFPDLYTVALFTNQIDLGPGNWSLMSSGGWGADGHSPQFPSHMGAWPLQYLGWDNTFRPLSDTTIVLEPIEAGGPIVELWFQGESDPEHFLIENRQRLGFDRNLHAEGLIVYHVDDAMIGQRMILNSINSGPTPGLRLVEADGDDDLVHSQNRGDVNDPFPGALQRTRIDDDGIPNTRAFAGGITHLALTGIAAQGDAMRFHARVFSPGWQPVQDFTPPGYDPVETAGQGRARVVDDRGVAHWVSSERDEGRARIALRSGRGGWEAPFWVSDGPRDAFDPTIAALPGGDLAIVWSDRRSGRHELWFRSRIGDVWSAERLLIALPGDCRYPALGIDRRGMLSLAFQQVVDGDAQIRFMRFTWFSPFGQSIPVTSKPQRPGPPAIVVAQDGSTSLAWIERTATPQRLWFTRYDPDSGVVPPISLTAPPATPQNSFSMTADRRGTLHIVWQTSGPGRSEIHYQRRPRGAAVAQWDSLLDAEGYVLQNPSITADSADGLHIVYEALPAGIAEVRYLQSRPGVGWDAVSTRVTDVQDGTASRPVALPASDREVAIAYNQFTDDGTRIRMRRRVVGATALTAAVPIEPTGTFLRCGPNPLRAGAPLELIWNGVGPVERPRVELFDLAGRRVAEAPLIPAGRGWRAHLSGERTRALAAGVLFARVPGAPQATVRLVVVR
jgi:immune inhibitor A